MQDTLQTLHAVPLYIWIAGGIAALTLFSLVFGVVVIREHESGLVIRRFGRSLPAGRIIATRGEAGFQAGMLPPGVHFPLWSWKYKITKVPHTEVPPGEIAVVVAKDGAAIPTDRVLARALACDDFQDAARFLEQGGEKGRQLSIITAGKYRINPALFDVVTAGRAEQFGLTATDLQVFRVPADRVGIITALDGRPIAAGDLAGPIVAGHDMFQRAQAFIDAGGCRGLQEEVLLSGAWNLNPWFACVELIPLSEVVRSEQQVLIQHKVSEARVAEARGEAEAIRVTAAADADALRLRGDANADAERARGAAAAQSYKAGSDALGEGSYTAVQLAQILGAAGMKLVPDVVLGEGKGSLADVLMARMATGRPLAGLPAALPEIVVTNGHSKA